MKAICASLDSNLTRRWISLAVLSLWVTLADAASNGRETPGPGTPAVETKQPGLTWSRPPLWPESVLDPEQRAQYRAALDQLEPQARELDTRLQMARSDLDDAILAEQFDAEQIRNRYFAFAKLEAERMVLRARALARIRSSLTLHQLEALKGRDYVPRPKLTDDEREAKRREIRDDLEKRVQAEHEAKRAQLREKLESQLAELRKKETANTLTEEERARMVRIDTMIKHMKTNAVPGSGPGLEKSPSEPAQQPPK